ncbi:hypothetical protein NQ317_014674 [Molorchus minor]|uniref:SPEF2 C-terminal domain-containing protein n=1 Tax=Molorchus minor TaxID=1323400 RepID=A0ABQ9IYN8_9CUCU|nr:hypothetical protein NQ317_014674 [Molorchus minor]
MSAGKDKKGKKDAPIIIVHEDKTTQAPEEEEEIVEEVEIPEIPKPGEPAWEYTNLAFPNDLKITLATFWENAEEVYGEDFKQVFFLKRLILNAIMPFVNYVKEHMSVYITRPDDQQLYIREFQRTYNEFDDDIRNDEEFKAEIHCRINEMKEKLIEICDRRMMEAEKERCEVISKNWAPKQFVELVNDYINGLQLELDRYVDSLQLLGDYYTGVVSKMPNEDSIKKDQLPKLDINNVQVAEGINSMFQYVDDELGLNPLKPMVDDIVLKARDYIEKVQGMAGAIMKKVRGLFAPEGKGKKKPPKPKKDKKGKGNILTLFEPDDAVKQAADKIFDEWSCAIRGETVRARLRLELLKFDLFSNLDEIVNITQQTFHRLYEEIHTRYRNEVNSVNTACLVLSRAVEEEIAVQEELFLKDGRFYIDPDSILFTDKIPPAKPLAEYESSEVFTIVDLDKLTDVLFDLAPSGYITQRCFLYLIQDLIITDDCFIRIPETWRKLQPGEVTRLFQQLFDDLEYTQWKDFILYNFMTPFPNDDELIQMRQQFREYDPDSTELITDYQFLSTDLWFETIEDEIRAKLMKKLLFKLYRVRNDKLNYTAMLLDLSKDDNAVAGLGKALGVSLGRAVCWDKDVGEQFITETLDRRRKHEEMVRIRNEERRENVEMAEDILTDLIDHTVHVCDSVVIEDLDVVPDYEINDYDVQEPEGEHDFVMDYREMMGEGEESDYGFTNTAISFEVAAAPSCVFLTL